MKTTSQTQISTPGLGSRTKQLPSGTGPQQAQPTKSLPRISFERRRANRRLLVGQLLSLLRNEAPHFFDLAEVVGQWVWIQFEHRQPRPSPASLPSLAFIGTAAEKYGSTPADTIARERTKTPARSTAPIFQGIAAPIERNPPYEFSL